MTNSNLNSISFGLAFDDKYFISFHLKKMVNLELDSKIRKDGTYLSQSGETIIPRYLDYILTIIVH